MCDAGSSNLALAGATFLNTANGVPVKIPRLVIMIKGPMRDGRSFMHIRPRSLALTLALFNGGAFFQS